MKTLKVLYEFQAEAGTELSVTEGETLTIVNKDAGEGWWMARLDHVWNLKKKVFLNFLIATESQNNEWF